jgi:putative transposase
MDRAQEYHNIVQERLDSGKSVKEFCEERGIRPSLYYYWRKKHLDQRESKFQHIQVSSSGPGAGMRILYPNGVQLELYGEVNLAQIRTLIDVGL